MSILVCIVAIALAPLPLLATQDNIPVGRWSSYINGLPNLQLPQVPLLGNGHLGVALDSTDKAGEFVGPHTANALDLWIGSNSLWSCTSCANVDPDHTVPACCSAVALGGVSVRLGPTFPSSTPLPDFTASQIIENATLTATWTTVHGGLVLMTVNMHPDLDVFLVNVSYAPTSSDPQVLILDFATWILSDGSVSHSWNTGTPAPASIGCDNTMVFGSRNLSTVEATVMPITAALAMGFFLGPNAYLESTAVVSNTTTTPPGKIPWEAVARVSIPAFSWAAAVTAEAESRGPGGINPVPAAATLVAQVLVGPPSDIAVASLAWWTDFWAQSSVNLPTRPSVSALWYGAQYILACASPHVADEDKPAPGLYGPWVTVDGPNWHGDYTLDYNYAAPFYGVFGSNHPSLAEGYWGVLVDWMKPAQIKAKVQAAMANVSCPSNALYFDCHLAPWGLASLDPMTRFMTWNGAHAMLAEINRWEYTFDVLHAQQVTYPLLDGITAWYTCYLTRNSTTGLWADTNRLNPDMEHEEQPVPNPQIALALILRVVQAQVDMAKALDIPLPAAVADLAVNLTPFNAGNVNMSLPTGPFIVLANTRCSDVTASWTFYNIPTVEACEAQCNATPSCQVFSYCPPVSVNNVTGCAGPDGPNDQPRPFTCWGMPIDQLNHCSSSPANRGWTSGYTESSSQAAPIWTAYQGATVAQSDWFSSYPSWPSEAVDPFELDGPAIAQASVMTYADLVNGRGVDMAATAVRAGFNSTSQLGLSPTTVLQLLEQFLNNYGGPSLLPTAPGGGIENAGMSRAVNEMLIQSVRLPGGFAVTASFNNGSVASPFFVTASYALGDSSLCQISNPWPTATVVTANCGGVSQNVTWIEIGQIFEFRAPRGISCEVSTYFSAFSPSAVLYTMPATLDLDNASIVRVNPTTTPLDQTLVDFWRLGEMTLSPVTAWDVGNWSGFFLPSTLWAHDQRAFYPDHLGTTAMQYRDGVFGAQLNLFDTPIQPPSESLATITFEYNWSPGTSVRPFPTLAAFLDLSVNYQAASAYKTGIAVYSSWSLGLMHFPTQKFIWYETALFDLDRPLGSDVVWIDTISNNAIIHGVLSTEEPSAFHTVQPNSALSSNSTWTGFRNFHFTISGAQLLAGINAANSKFNLGLSTNVSEYNLVHFNVEAEGTGNGRLGHSLCNLTVANFV